MIDFASVKGVHIPDGDVSKIVDSQGNVLWNIPNAGTGTFVAPTGQ